MFKRLLALFSLAASSTLPCVADDIHSISIFGTTLDFIWVPVDAPEGVKRVRIDDFSGKHPKEKERNESIYAPFSKNGKRGYYLGKTEVTEKQWAAVVGQGARSSRLVPHTPDGAVGFVKLPTEAEWEYAARGGVWSGYGESNPYGGDVERHEVFSLPGSDGKAKEVGSRPPNRLGLHDMLGNVRELMEGSYSVGRVVGGGFLLKGGSYLSEKGELRSSSRTEHQRTGKDGKPTQRPDAGLRLAISAEIMTSFEAELPGFENSAEPALQ